MARSAFDSFLSHHDPAAARLARPLRTLLKKRLPSAIETSDLDLWAIGHEAGYRGTVFVISPQKGHVNLGFYDGASLPDPDTLLEGSGKVHRHVKIRDRRQLDDPHLARLIRAAVKRADAERRRSE
jgi:hypothetical protein